MSAIRVELELADGTFTSRMLHAGESLTRFNQNLIASKQSLAQFNNVATAAQNGLARLDGKNVAVFRSLQATNEASRGFLENMRDLSVVVGIAGLAITKLQGIASTWIGSIVKTNIELERLSALLAGMSTAAEPVADAARQIEQLQQIALRVPFSMKALTETFVRLKATGIDPMAGAMQSLADAVAASGGSDETLNRAALAISQMSGKGVIQMEELRQQLGEAVPRATELMARSMGVSMAEMINQIGTGLVKSKPALEALAREFELTFGGAAARQMQTLGGQFAQLQTRYQILAKVVGDAGFSDALRTQVSDLNTFLSGSTAKGLAEGLGRALTSVVETLRQAVEWLGRFSGVVTTIRDAIATTAGFIGRFADEITIFGAALLGVFVVQRVVGVLAAWSAGVATFGNILKITIGNIIAAQTALGTLAAAGSLFMALLPSLALLGAAIYAIGINFGFFSNKGADATARLREFRAESNKQIDDAQRYVEAETRRQRAIEQTSMAQLEALRREQDLLRASGRPSTGYRGMALRSTIEDLEESISSARQKLAELGQDQATVERRRSEFERDQIERRIRDAYDAYQRQLSEQQRILDIQKTQIQDYYNKEREIRQAAGRSVDELEERRKQDLQAADLAYYDSAIEALTEWIDIQNRLLESSSENQRSAAAATVNEASRQLETLRRQREAEAERIRGIETLARELNTKELLKRGDTELNKIRADIAGMKAELAGASNEAEKLAYILIQGMKYGDPSNAQIRTLIDNLLEGQREADELHRAIAGRRQFGSDLDSLIKRLQDQIVDLVAKKDDLTDLEKILLRYQSGMYQGYTPARSPMSTFLNDIEAGFKKAGVEAKFAAETMKSAFVDTGLTGILERFTTTVGNLADAWARIGQMPGTGLGGVAEVARTASGAVRAAITPGPRETVSPTATPTTPAEPKPTVVEPKVTVILPPVPEPAKPPAAIVPEGRAAAPTGGPVPPTRLDPDRARISETFASAVETNQAQTKLFIEALTKNSQTLVGARTGVPGQRIPDTLDPEMAGKAQVAARLQGIVEQLKPGAALTDAINKMKTGIADAKVEAAGFGSNLARARAELENGKYGTVGKEITQAQADEFLRAAAERDRIEKEAAATRERQNAADNAGKAIARERVELAAKEADARRRLLDPNEMKGSDAYFNQESRYREALEGIKAVYGEESIAYRTLLAEKNGYLQQFQNVEIMQYMAGLEKKNQELRRSFMTESAAKQAAANEEIAQIQRYVAAFRGSAEDRVLIEKTANERIAMLRQQASMGPLAQQFRQWADLRTQIETSMTGWLNSSTDALAQFIVTGQTDWRALSQTIMTDLVRMSLRWSLSQMMAPVMSGSAKGTAVGTGAKTGKMAAVAHSGGIVGIDRLASRAANPAIFAGAQRFHSGGMVGGPKLGPNEVPIIAQKGEGIFTPGQMKALAGSGRGTVNFKNEITLNATGGSPEANADLAAQVARQVEATTRQIVVSEIQTQMRPGGMFRPAY